MIKFNKNLFGMHFVTITNYIYWYFMSNLYFILVNLPLLFILLTILANGSKPIPAGYGLIIFISCIPLGPSITALLSVMDKLIKDKDLSITKDFFQAYRIKFKQSLWLWLGEMLLITLLFINTKFFIIHSYPHFIKIYIYVIQLLIFTIGLYVFLIISHFSLRNKIVIKLAVYSTVKFFKITFLLLIYFIISIYFLSNISNLLILFIPSLLCFLIMFSSQNLLLKLSSVK